MRRSALRSIRASFLVIHKIVQLELAMVLYTLAARAQSFRDRRGFWYIDNLVALIILIRSRSNSPDLE